MVFRKAVLIIHGFAGGTYDEEELANYLELNRGFDVYQFTLPGHEKNLSKVHYLEWINAADDKVRFLINEGYRQIYLIGHSMGGVIATYLSTKYNEIKKLVLAAPAFQYLSVEKDHLNVIESLKKTPKIVKTYGNNEIISRFLKLDLSAIKEFMNLVKEYYDYPNNITCKLLIIQGKNDNLVPLSSSEYVYNAAKSKFKNLVYVDNLTHDIFRSERSMEMFKLTEKFLKRNIRMGVIDYDTRRS